MNDEVVFVTASADYPNTDEINRVCREMSDRGLTLANSAPCQGTNEEGSAITVGLWLFFSDSDRANFNETDYGAARPTTPRRWSP